MLIEEVNRKNSEGSKSSNILVVKGSSQNKEKNAQRSHSRSKSHTPKKEVKCYYCHKKGHMKNCHKWNTDKEKEKNHEGGKSDSQGKSDEANTCMEEKDSDVLFMLAINHANLVATDSYALKDWIFSCHSK